MELVGKTNEEKIWNYLSSIIDNKYGIAGLMGNLYFVSLLDSYHVETSFLQKNKITKKEYTNKTDIGLHDFIRDKVGYGIANWKFWLKKEGLKKQAYSQKKSVGDLKLQLDFLIKELQEDYPDVWDILNKTKTIKDASNKVLIDYIVPKNKNSKNLQNAVLVHGKYYYDLFTNNKKVKQKEEKQKIISTLEQSKFALYFLDENSQYVANSNNKKEISYVPWSNESWSYILRHEDLEFAIKLAELALQADENEFILYGEKNKWRKTYFNALSEAGYNPKKIKKDCYTTDLDFIVDNIKAIGFIKNIAKLKVLNIKNIENIKKELLKYGFQIYVSPDYINTPNNLLPGDILVNEKNNFIAINLSLGKNYYGDE